MPTRFRKRLSPVPDMRLDDVDRDVVDFRHEVLRHFLGRPIGEFGTVRFERWIVGQPTVCWKSRAHAGMLLAIVIRENALLEPKYFLLIHPLKSRSWWAIMRQPADASAGLNTIVTLAVMKFKLLILLFVLTAGAQAEQPGSPLSTQSVFSPYNIMVIGHRGAAGSAPENTLAAIKEALKQGADAIEVDLHQSADNVVVAIHDDTVDRTTDGEGKVADLTITQLKDLDAGGWFDAKFAGEKIPTLEEVFRTVPEKTVLILEVKEGKETYPGIESRIVNALRKAGRTNVILKSFSIEVLEAFERLASDYVRLYVFNAHIPFLNLIVDDGLRLGNAFDQNVSWLQKHSSFITDGFVRRAQERGIQVVAWNVHDPAKMREMIGLRVDAIETDYPAVLKRMLAKAVKVPVEAVR